MDAVATRKPLEDRLQLNAAQRPCPIAEQETKAQGRC